MKHVVYEQQRGFQFRMGHKINANYIVSSMAIDQVLPYEKLAAQLNQLNENSCSGVSWPQGAAG